MDIQNKIERFKNEKISISKDNMINKLFQDNKVLYEYLSIYEKNNKKSYIINVAFTSICIFIEYQLTQKDNYLHEFIVEKLSYIQNKKSCIDKTYYYHLLKFLVNFIQICFLQTQDKSYLNHINCIYIELLFMNNNHNIEYKM